MAHGTAAMASAVRVLGALGPHPRPRGRLPHALPAPLSSHGGTFRSAHQMSPSPRNARVAAFSDWEMCNPRAQATTESKIDDLEDGKGGPAWDLSTEYDSLSSEALVFDIKTILEALDMIQLKSGTIESALPLAGSMSVEDARNDEVLVALMQVSELRWRASRFLGNVRTYAFCESSTDSKSAKARALVAQSQSLGAKLDSSLKPYTLFLTLCRADVLEAYLDMGGSKSAAGGSTAAEEAMWVHARKMQTHMLSLQEEALTSKLQVNGLSAWGNMYDSISGSIVCQVALPSYSPGWKEMGLAAASGLLSSEDEVERRAAWEAIQEGWSVHEEACAATLNAISGWRLDVYEERHYGDFLEAPLHDNRLEAASLDAMLAAIDARGDMARRGLEVQAQALGKPALDPWDLFAPPPSGGGDKSSGGAGGGGGGAGGEYSWEEAVELIRDAVAEELDPEVGEFVQMMVDNKWVEARRGSSKKPGAYCTAFLKSRTPRVYMSNFSNSAGGVLTLAHELGHAYHNWVMKELPLPKSSYPMNLAETASLMFETVVGDALVARASSPALKFKYGWGDVESASAFLLNIPARFAFEKAMYERRPEGPLPPDELSSLMQKSLARYYQGSLTRTDPSFWMSKLHFYLTSISFYNFPYSFGYLFALGVYAQKEALGEGFFPAYNALLRDTGTMSSEELVLKHLGADIRDVAFWERSLDIVEAKVVAFEEAARDAGFMVDAEEGYNI